MKKMRIWLRYLAIYVSVFFLVPLDGDSQILYTNRYKLSDGHIYVNKLDLSTCTEENVLELEYRHISLCIALHPDGTMYIVTSRSLLHVDLAVGLLEEIEFPETYGGYIGIVCDIYGNLYMSGWRLDKYDTRTREFSHLGDYPENFYGGADMTIRGGEFYVSGTNTEHNYSVIVKVDMTDVSKSKEVFYSEEIRHKYGFPGFSTIYKECNQFNTYAFDYETIYEMDFTTGDLIPICHYSALGFLRPAGATSPSEFLASDVECDLLLDLDRDNSSGVYPYDFDNKSILCNPNQSTHVVDDDVYLHTSADLDSIVITMSGNNEGTQEQLTLSHDEPGVSLTNDDGRYLLILTGDKSDTAWMDALRLIRYTHIGDTPTPGVRTLTFTAYNVIKSNVANTYIHIEIPDSGVDRVLAVCEGQKITSLSEYMGGQEGGRWEPALTSDNTYDPLTDLASEYLYITTSAMCGSDTSVLTIEKYPERILDIGGEVALCRGETYETIIDTVPGDEVIWSDGSTDVHRILDIPGTYIATLITADGCRISDTLSIVLSQETIPAVVTEYLCPSDVYLYKGVTYVAGQTITDTIAAEYGCDTLLTISLEPSPVSIAYKDTLTCENMPIIIGGVSWFVGDTMERYVSSAIGCDTLLHVIYREHQPTEWSVEVSEPVVCVGASATVIAHDADNVSWSTGKMTNTIQLPPGNYWVKNTDNLGCVTEQNFEIDSYAETMYETTVIQPDCIGNTGEIRIIQPEDKTLSVVINDIPATDGILEGLGAGDYTIVVTDENGCSYNGIVTLESGYEYDVLMPDNITIQKHETGVVNFTDDGGKTVSIDIIPKDDIYTEGNSIYIKGVEERKYTIRFTDEKGCEVERYLNVFIAEPAENFFMPNVISSHEKNSPNRYFYILNDGYTYDLTVYDRWGNVMFDDKNIESGDPNTGWSPEASKVQQGVFVYLVKIYTSEGIVYKAGTITVL